MQKQTNPTYGQYIGKSDPVVADRLIEKYGYFLNPIIIRTLQQSRIFYLYELTIEDYVKYPSPTSRNGRTSFVLDFKNRTFYPQCEMLPLKEMMEGENTYEFIQNHPFGKRYRTVDVDYLWRADKGWKMIELTTFFVEFQSLQHARNLIATMNRRPSWRGDGALAWSLLVDVAQDFEAEVFVVCMNSISSSNYQIKEGSKAYIFPLNQENIMRISQGQPPLGDQLLSDLEFAQWL